MPTIYWGSKNEPLSIYYHDIYYNRYGAITEKTYVFIHGNNLVDRFLSHRHDTFVIGETGFGIGLNFILAWHVFLQFRRHYPHHRLKKMRFISVEKFPLSEQELTDVHNRLFDEQYNELRLLSQKLRGFHSTQLTLFGDVTLALLIDDIQHYPAFLHRQNQFVDAWFFDGFSPEKNPEMWSTHLFNACFSCTRFGGSFATYTAASWVNKNLIEAGFTTVKKKGYGKKRHMLVGEKQ